jgi:hypothetical protein
MPLLRMAVIILESSRRTSSARHVFDEAKGGGLLRLAGTKSGACGKARIDTPGTRAKPQLENVLTGRSLLSKFVDLCEKITVAPFDEAT